MMNLNLPFVALCAMFFSVAGASPVTLESRDIFVPPILYPTAVTVWQAGSHHNVTWDISGAPANITNMIGEIFLRKGGLVDNNPPIASGFSILDGAHVIQVPEVVPGSDYQILLLGDSGNLSPRFTIEA